MSPTEDMSMSRSTIHFVIALKPTGMRNVHTTSPCPRVERAPIDRRAISAVQILDAATL